MKDLLREAVRFGLVGLGATIVHLLIAWVANRMGGTPPYLANALGFATAFGVSYLGHFRWTFGGRSPHADALPRFLVVALTGYALSNVIILLVVTRAGQAFEWALLAILMTVPLTTWILSRLWAFRSRS